MAENVESFNVEGKSSGEIYLSGSACKPFSGLSDDSANKKERQEMINALSSFINWERGEGKGNKGNEPTGIISEFVNNYPFIFNEHKELLFRYLFQTTKTLYP